jgi:phosphoserine aminotransferase
MNVMFTTNDDKLDDQFIQLAEDKGCVGIRGHRITKGCRASIYNAMSLEGVKALISCMNEFENTIIEEKVNV